MVHMGCVTFHLPFSCLLCFQFCCKVTSIHLTFFLSASSSFMTDARFPEGRKLLALYPVLLFYLSLAWIVLIGFQQGSRNSVVEEGVPPVSSPKNIEETGNGNETGEGERILQALGWALTE